MYYDEREAAAAVCNIDNAVLQLEVFFRKRKAAIPMIEDIIHTLRDGGLEQRDVFRCHLFESLLNHLINLG